MLLGGFPCNPIAMLPQYIIYNKISNVFQSLKRQYNLAKEALLLLLNIQETTIMSSEAGNNAVKTGSEGSGEGKSTNRNLIASSENNELHYNQVSFLPIVHAIIHTIEKDNQEASQKNRDSLDASQKVAELAKKIESARSHIYKLPGITDSKLVQLERLQNLHTQLEMKKDLISKYKGLNMKLGSAHSDDSLMQATDCTDNVQK